MQNDFITGSLAVPHAEDIINPIIELIETKPWDSIVFTKDWHPADHISFADTHHKAVFSDITYRDPQNEGREIVSKLWPPHCVMNTHGAELTPILQSFIDKNEKRLPIEIVKKGMFSDREYYSVFNDIWEDHYTELHQLLQRKGITEVVVVGLATDFCVLHSALSAGKLGYTTEVIEELTRPVDPQFQLATRLSEEPVAEPTGETSSGPTGRSLRICTAAEV